MSNIAVIVGGQFGSEAKGHVTAQVVKKFLEEGVTQAINIRVAGPNAGHTVYDTYGNKFAFRQIPVGAVLDGSVVAVIAAGSEVDPEVLMAEVGLMHKHGHYPILLVDGNATLITDEHREAEGNAALVGRIGSTGKGIGAARADRIMRTAKRVGDSPELVGWLNVHGVSVVNTSMYIARWVEEPNTAIVIEGTQGYGLGVHTQYYPTSTSSDCRAIDFLAMAGISPWSPGVQDLKVIIVCRVFPIRVAGNSGPMRNETTWEELGLPEERTTVTQKVRRVGLWDTELVRQAVRDNGGTRVSAAVQLAITMVDQKVPEFADFEHCPPGTPCKHKGTIPESAYEALNDLLRGIQDEIDAPILLATTGPRTAVWF